MSESWSIVIRGALGLVKITFVTQPPRGVHSSYVILGGKGLGYRLRGVERSISSWAGFGS